MRPKLRSLVALSTLTAKLFSWDPKMDLTGLLRRPAVLPGPGFLSLVFWRVLAARWFGCLRIALFKMSVVLGLATGVS